MLFYRHLFMGEHQIYGNLHTYFANELEELNCNENTRSYITNLLSSFRNSSIDYSNESLTLIYWDAQQKGDFVKYQRLADWVLFTASIFPEHLNGATTEYYYSIGQLSYYACYRLLNRSWQLYEELADDFVPLSEQTRSIIRRY